MKRCLIVLSLLVVSNLYSQDGPPTASQIRQAIAGQIIEMRVAPQPIFRIVDKAVWNGTDSIKVRMYVPKAGNKQRIVYNIHGGALVAGDLNTHDNISRLLANRTNSIVVALDYRKPPESAYPASLDDCITVLNWIKKTASSWGGDTSDLVLVGDSGGGLLITALALKEQQQLRASKIVLINPAVDLRNPAPGLYSLVTSMYLGGQHADDPLISPVLAKDVSFFPPTLIVTSEKDVLKEQAVEFHNKLQQAQVYSKLTDIPNEDHLGGYWAAAHSVAKLAIDETVKFILATSSK